MSLGMVFKAQDDDHPRVVGAMGGHVDDFHRIGDEKSPEWLEIKDKVGAYAIDLNQLYAQGKLDTKEIAACRASLGALQWSHNLNFAHVATFF